MKHLIVQGRTLVLKIRILKFLADTDSISGALLFKQLTDQLRRDCLKLESAIGLYFARIHPASVDLKKIPGSRYEHKEHRADYRCWACKRFGVEGKKGCINTFLNRPACKVFIPNGIIRKHPDRIHVLKKTKGNRPPKLKPPIIEQFNHHYVKCRVCQKIKGNARSSVHELQVRHYRKAKLRKQRKLMTYFAFYGVKYFEKYIFGWED